MRQRGIIHAAVGICVATGVIGFAIPAHANGSGFQVFVHMSQSSPTPTTITVDVEGDDSVEGLKQKIQDHGGGAPQNMCLIQGDKKLRDGFTLSDENVQANSTIELYNIPVSAVWSITPDEPVLGGQVSNAPITHPSAVSASVVSGALPLGVSLNSSTGAVTGKFDSLGPFDVTLRVTTLCGDADISWSGVVTGQLPNTGGSTSYASGVAVGASLLVACGAVLISRRRRRMT